VDVGGVVSCGYEIFDGVVVVVVVLMMAVWLAVAIWKLVACCDCYVLRCQNFTILLMSQLTSPRVTIQLTTSAES
jgi:hypothetical protein